MNHMLRLNTRPAILRRRLERRPGGFSLLEMLVALSMSAVILTVTTSALVTNITNEKRARARSAMMREGAFASAVLTGALRNAGLGVPVSPHLDNGELHTHVVTVGTTHTVGIVADVARPHRHLATFGELHGRAPFSGSDCPSDPGYNAAATGPAHRHAYLAWHTPNNGACMPGSGTLSCRIEATSQFFPNELAGQRCTSWGHRMCPWGMGRLSPNEPFQIIAAGGLWTDAVFPTAPALEEKRNTFFLELNTGWTDASDTWSNCSGAAPHEVTGGGYVTTLDRIFFRICEKGNLGACNTAVPANPPYVLQRKQCWGRVEPSHANWPNGSNSIASPSALSTDVDCQPDPDAEWESLLSDIEQFRFAFFDSGDATNAPTALTLPLAEADKANVRRFVFEMTLQKDIDGFEVRHDLAGSVAIRNPL